MGAPRLRLPPLPVEKRPTTNRTGPRTVRVPTCAEGRHKDRRHWAGGRCASCWTLAVRQLKAEEDRRRADDGEPFPELHRADLGRLVAVVGVGLLTADQGARSRILEHAAATGTLSVTLERISPNLARLSLAGVRLADVPLATLEARR